MGAHGYLLKNAFKDGVLAGIRTVLAGHRFLYSKISLTLLERVVNAPAVPAPAHSPLPRREYEVLQLVAEGLTNQQIADQLFTSKRTVETHRQNVLQKTGCRNGFPHQLRQYAGTTIGSRITDS